MPRSSQPYCGDRDRDAPRRAGATRVLPRPGGQPGRGRGPHPRRRRPGGVPRGVPARLRRARVRSRAARGAAGRPVRRRAVAEAAEAHATTVVAGMFETSPDPDRPWNTLVLRGTVPAAYRKIHLYDSFGYRESDRVRAGEPEPVVVEVGGFRVGLMTCYDLRFPELGRLLADAGAEVLVVPAAWVAGARKVEHWRTLARARAIENTAYVVAVGQPGPRYSGHSLVVDPLGRRGGRGRRRGGDAHRHADPGPPRRGAPHQPLAAQSPVVAFLPVSTPRAPGRRAAPRPPSRLSVEAVGRSPLPVVGCVLMVLGGLAALVVEALGLAPEVVATAGAVSVSTAYAWARRGPHRGRPVVFGLLALGIGARRPGHRRGHAALGRRGAHHLGQRRARGADHGAGRQGRARRARGAHRLRGGGHRRGGRDRLRPAAVAGPLRVHDAGAGPGDRLRARLPARRGPARPRPARAWW